MISSICSLVLIGLAVVSAQNTGQPVSPCPHIFTYEQRGTEPGKWYGVINLTTDIVLHGLWLNVVLDTKADILGNWVGEVSTKDNIDFKVENSETRINPGPPVPVRFFVQYNPMNKVPILKAIRLNGKEICNIVVQRPEIALGIPDTVIQPDRSDTRSTPMVDFVKPPVRIDTNTRTENINIDSVNENFSSNIEIKNISIETTPPTTDSGLDFRSGTTESDLSRFNTTTSRNDFLSELNTTTSIINFLSELNTNTSRNDFLSELNNTTSRNDFLSELSTTTLRNDFLSELNNTTSRNDFLSELSTTTSRNDFISKFDTTTSRNDFYIKPENTRYDTVSKPQVPVQSVRDDFIYERPNTPIKSSNVRGNPSSTQYFLGPDGFVIVTTSTTRISNSPSYNNHRGGEIYDDDYDGEYVGGIPTIYIPSNIDKGSYGPKKVQCGRVIFNNSRAEVLENGAASLEGQYPWQIAIYQNQKSGENKYICGATLVSHRHAITAAHCVTRPGTSKIVNRNTLTMYLGKNNLRTSVDGVQIKFVENILVHPNYNASTLNRDIAILQLKESVSYTDHVLPICLWPETLQDLSSIIGKHGSLVGWGFEDSGLAKQELTLVKMPVVDSDTCVKSYSAFFARILSEYSYCATYAEGTSVCNGDSGGGMVFKSGDTWYLRGVASLSVARQNQFRCDPNHYVIFTDVAKLLPWIRANIYDY